MNQRYVDQNCPGHDPGNERLPAPDSPVGLERVEKAREDDELVLPLDRSLDLELGDRLDRIRRPAAGAVGFADWVAGETTLTAARSAYVMGDVATADERLDQAERSFVRAGSPIDAAAVGLERAALAALGRDDATLAEIARRAEIRLLSDLPVGLRAALGMLIRAIQTAGASPGLTAALAEYGHMVRTGTTVATRFDRSERPIPELPAAEIPTIEQFPEEDDGEGTRE
ncbi:MAG: hypothetical protein ABJC13_18960 [Acidobacteriota bacterium]